MRISGKGWKRLFVSLRKKLITESRYYKETLEHSE